MGCGAPSTPQRAVVRTSAGPPGAGSRSTGAPTGHAAQSSMPGGARAGAGGGISVGRWRWRRMPGARRVRPCADRRSSDRNLDLCMRTGPVARFGSRHTGTARSRRRGTHTAETPGTRPRRTGATRRRPEAAQTRRGTSRNGRAPPYTGPTRSGLAECTRPGAHRHHGAGTVPTSPQRGVAATAGSGGNAQSIRVPIGRGVMDESRASCHTTGMRSAALSAAL